MQHAATRNLIEHGTVMRKVKDMSRAGNNRWIKVSTELATFLWDTATCMYVSGNMRPTMFRTPNQL